MIIFDRNDTLLVVPVVVPICLFICLFVCLSGPRLALPFPDTRVRIKDEERVLTHQNHIPV